MFELPGAQNLEGIFGGSAESRANQVDLGRAHKEPGLPSLVRARHAVANFDTSVCCELGRGQE